MILGTVGLNDLKIGYDHHTAKYMDVGPTGSIQTTVGNNTAVFKFVIDKTGEGHGVRLVEFKPWILGKYAFYLVYLGKTVT